ncbi:MAG: BamA/TamA family outer membrane protein [Flavisolibacter sp.]|nr:BamA/TamA family outer membrane protein [Flavisolibacter sp.]
MTKIKHWGQVLLIALLSCFTGWAQKTYTVNYHIVDSAQQRSDVGLEHHFPSAIAAAEYVAQLPVYLQNKGFVSSSIDSVQRDSLQANVHLFLGEQYQWAHLYTLSADEDLLQAVRWNNRQFSGAGVNFSNLQATQNSLLNYLEEHGYPFAKIYLDSISINNNEVTALLKINRGPLYKVDSIRVYGDAKVSNDFLQRYLNIASGSIYNRRVLDQVDKKLADLTYVQIERPSNLTLLGTGSVLNLYLKAKKSSQINVLIGFLPDNEQISSKKLLLTGEANVLLRNALSSGETIGLNWQQLQYKSPRLNLLYEHPFIFHSPFGLGFTFDMLRKDTTYLNLNMRLGTSYLLGQTKTATLFLQRRQTIVNGINTTYVLQTKQLPQDADVGSLDFGVQYHITTTDYRLNPRKGTEVLLTTAAGAKRLRKNNAILELKDGSDPAFQFERLYDTIKMKSYQLRAEARAAHFFPMGKQSTVKTSVQAGAYSSGSVFRNELFQIGGYKLLRGFDEESQFVAQYAIATLEYRYLVGLNSYFFLFTDGGWGRNPLEVRKNHSYLGTGLGMAFETKAGIFSLVWAVGKRDDVPFNLRQSKVHLGFVNYF